MIRKLKLTTLLAAAVLFLFPWIDVQCSGKSMVTQTGLQTIYGGASASKEMETLGGGDKTSSEEKKDSAGFAPLVACSLLCLLAAIALSLKAIFLNDKNADTNSGVFSTVALLLLLAQLVFGFPVEKKMRESDVKGGSSEMGDAMSKAMLASIQVRNMVPFYLELLALGFPTLVMLNAFIDEHRVKDETER